MPAGPARIRFPEPRGPGALLPRGARGRAPGGRSMNLIEAIAALRAHNSSGSAFLNTLGSVDGWKHGLGAMVDGKGNNMSSILFAAEWEARALGFPVPREDRGALDLSKWRRTEAGARLGAHAVRRPTMRRVPLPP